MFDGPGPRVFGLAPGVDFPKALLFGLEERLKGAPPEAWAKIELYVNTRRMQRRLVALLNEGPPRLLPNIRLVSELDDPGALPPPVPPLRRRLELSQLVSGLLEREPDLAPSATLFDLSDSLAALMDEMQGEGVAPGVLRDLDVSHLSAHWARTQRFLQIVEQLFRDDALDAEARRRLVAERLAARWAEAPPQHPVIIAGSTGSRGATALFMEAVARLPQGAVVLPGFDFEQPDHVWGALDDAMTAEDHPQFRFHALLRRLGAPVGSVTPWHAASVAPSAARNRLVSLALRPAPVTDQWLDEGPLLKQIGAATKTIAIVEAPSPRSEALAIALRLRQADAEGQAAALITPDRMLTRQVTAALDLWGIEPDDSAGLPLPLSAPGRFLRHVASLFGQKLGADALLVLLKHPLTASGAERNTHLLWTRELELYFRRGGPPFPTGDDLRHWAKDDAARQGWADWLATALDGVGAVGLQSLQDHVVRHLALAETLAAGPGVEGSGRLWEEAAGEEARKACNGLADEARHGGVLSPRDYADLFTSVLNRHEIHDPTRGHPGVMIWGTLEARVQGADLVILGGLNEGSWPELPPPDPWLNREMRLKSGLLLPERRIGLAAHDFQQAIAARHVVLTRAVRDAEAETVPSRWLNRLTNLLGGLEAQGGAAALDTMRARGRALLALGEKMEEPGPELPRGEAPRPSPCPPVAARPEQLSVTRIQTLVRDPYAIYAREVLGLKKLDPLRPEPDAPLRGTILHKVLERFIGEGDEIEPGRLMQIATDILEAEAPWPAARRIWHARLGRVADWLVRGEIERRANARPVALEVRGRASPYEGFTLTAEADRIDRRSDGRLIVYDYKTGIPPSPKQMREFDKQLLLEAAMAERGAFDGLPAAPVDHVAYIGLGSSPVVAADPLEDDLAGKTWAGLGRLIARYARHGTGYTARRALFERAVETDYDHLSRYGEWDESTPALKQELGG